MTPTQALSAIALLGGMNATARLVLNAGGAPMMRGNLVKAVNAPRGVPEWLAEQLYSAVARHGESCERWAMDVAAGGALE